MVLRNTILLFLIIFIINIASTNGQETEETEETFYYGITDLSLTDIKKLNVTILNETVTTCPQYSSGPRVVYSHDFPNNEITLCDMTFACYSDKCIYYKSSSYPFIIQEHKQYGLSYVNELNNNKRLTIHSCTPEDEFCFTQVACQTDDDCFSNKCSNGRCHVRNKGDLYLCLIKREVNDFSMDCLISLNEKCSMYTRCLTGYCDNYRSICSHNEIEYKPSFMSQYFFVFVGIVMLVFLTFILYIYSIKDKLLSRVRDGPIVHTHTSPDALQNHSVDSSMEDSEYMFNYTRNNNDSNNNPTDNNDHINDNNNDNNNNNNSENNNTSNNNNNTSNNNNNTSNNNNN